MPILAMFASFYWKLDDALSELWLWLWRPRLSVETQHNGKQSSETVSVWDFLWAKEDSQYIAVAPGRHRVGVEAVAILNRVVVERHRADAQVRLDAAILRSIKESMEEIRYMLEFPPRAPRVHSCQHCNCVPEVLPWESV